MRLWILILFCGLAMAQPPAPIPTKLSGPAYQDAVNTWLLWLYTNKAASASYTNVTNDAQTKASVVPNTLPSPGQILAGNADGAAYEPVTLSGSCTMTSAGVISCGASVPYTGAVSNVDVGAHKVLASAFEAPAGTALLLGGACQTAADIDTAGDTPASGEYALFFDADNSCHLTKIDSTSAKIDLESPQDRSTAARPTCDAESRGLWYVEKGTGGDGADVPMVCIQTSSTGPVFGWVLLSYTPA